MKKIVFFLLLCLPLASCTFEEAGTQKSVYDITVAPNQWQEVGYKGQSGYYLQATFQAPYITPNVLYEGAVVVYAEFVDASAQLPYVISDQIGSSRFITILSYKLDPRGGTITFTLEDSDFQTEPYSSNLKFKIVVLQ